MDLFKRIVLRTNCCLAMTTILLLFSINCHAATTLYLKNLQSSTYIGAIGDKIAQIKADVNHDATLSGSMEFYLAKGSQRVVLKTVGWSLANPYDGYGRTVYANNVVIPSTLGWGDCTLGATAYASGHSSTSTTTDFTIYPRITLTPSQGMNLLATTIDFSVLKVFSDSAKYASVWKWYSQYQNYAVYIPGEAIPGTYAKAHGYYSLVTINSGDGFWVDVKETSPTPITINGFTSYGPVTLTSGWNMVGLKTDKPSTTIEQFLNDKPGVISVWRWVANSWQVYMPGYADKGAAYAAANGYSLINTPIAPTEGLWINNQ